MAVGQAQQPVPTGQHPTAFIGKLSGIYLFHNQLVYVNRIKVKFNLYNLYFLYHLM